MSPVVGGELVAWNITHGIGPKHTSWDGRNSYYVNFGYGIDKSPYFFYVDVKTNVTWDLPSLDIAIIGEYVDTKLQTEEFQNFQKIFPKWAHITSVITLYESWRY